MKRNNIIKMSTAVIATLFLGVYTGCQPDEFGDGNGLTASNIDASITVTPIEGMKNKYIVKSNTDGVIGVSWDFGDGNKSSKPYDTLFYPDADKYTITLTTIGRGGVTKTATQDVVVSEPDPIAGNLIDGGKMRDGDDSKWTRVKYSDGVDWTLHDGVMTAAGGG